MFEGVERPKDRVGLIKNHKKHNLIYSDNIWFHNLQIQQIHEYSYLGQ